MTNRNFFELVANGTMNDEIIAFARKTIEESDSKRNAEKAKKDAENAPFIEAIQSVLTDKPQTASQIAAAVNISTPKATALLKKMSVKVGEMTVDKRIVKAYSL